VQALIGLGKIYNLRQQPGKAEDVLSRAIGLHPGDWSAYNALGMFLYGSGRFREAARQFETVVALDHRNVVGYANLGITYMLAGDFASAAPAFQRAIELEPRPSTYSNLGLMHYYLGDFDAAIEAHHEATNIAPDDYLIWSNLGDAYWAADKTDDSRRAFEKALTLAQPHFDINQNDPGLLMDLAWIRAMLDDLDSARALIGKALSLTPDDPYTHFISGLIELRSGDINAALGSLRSAAANGYSLEMLAAEPHLGSLRNHPEFNDLLESSGSP
jgi:Flp pilus assembly protein TadD